MQPNITVDHHQVVVEGTVVLRPSHLSPLQWLEFWNDAVSAAGTTEELEAENQSLKNDLDAANARVAEREEELKQVEQRLSDISTLASN